MSHPKLLDILNATVYRDEKKVFDDFSLSIEYGQSCAIIGPNGAGKSTLFKILAGLIHPTSGQIEINGKLWDRNDAKPLGHIGFVFQDPTVDPMRSGQANLVYAARLQGLTAHQFTQRIDELVDALDGAMNAANTVAVAIIASTTRANIPSPYIMPIHSWWSVATFPNTRA